MGGRQEYAKARTSRRRTTPLSPLTIQYIPMCLLICPTYNRLLIKCTFQCSSYSCHCTFLAPKLYIERAVCCRETQLLDIIESGGWPLFTFSGDGSISGIHPLRSDNVTCPDNVASTDPGHLFQHNPPALGFRQSGNLIDRQRGRRWQINI